MFYIYMDVKSSNSIVTTSFSNFLLSGKVVFTCYMFLSVIFMILYRQRSLSRQRFCRSMVVVQESALLSPTMLSCPSFSYILLYDIESSGPDDSTRRYPGNILSEIYYRSLVFSDRAELDNFLYHVFFYPTRKCKNFNSGIDSIFYKENE
jgi:hypothetical protein